MGNVCCQIDTDKSFIDEDILRRDNYQQTSLPVNDQVFLDWVQQNKIDIDVTNQGPVKAMKDRERQRYYYGEWREGVPEGKGLFYQPSKILFNGVFSQGIPTGPAKIKFIDSLSEFEGELKQGRANGPGTINNLKQKFKFAGEWENSRPQKGTLTFVTDPNISNIYFQDFSKRKGVINYQDTRKYEGQINTSKLVPDGRGVVTFPLNGAKESYDGQWHNGEMHGRGKFKWTDGSAYEGEFIHGKKEGTGTFYFSNGNRYEGFWVGGKQEGAGTLYSKDNQEIKKGIWKSGVFANPLLTNDDWVRESQISANKREKVLEEVQSQIKQEKKRQQQHLKVEQKNHFEDSVKKEEKQQPIEHKEEAAHFSTISNLNNEQPHTKIEIHQQKI